MGNTQTSAFFRMDVMGWWWWWSWTARWAVSPVSIDLIMELRAG